MKITLLFVCAAIIACTAQQASAKVWRVNNNSNYDGSTKWGSNFGGTQSYPVFAQLNQANSSNLVGNGDTIHLEGSSVKYADATITKSLIIIGPGYFLNENPNTAVTKLPAMIGEISFNTGSGSSQLIGVYVGGNTYRGININISDIVIKRCVIEYSITLVPNTSNIHVIENYFAHVYDNGDNILSVGNSGFPTDFYFNNNICKGPLQVYFYEGSPYYIQECNNNTFDYPTSTKKRTIYLNAGVFQNNILKNPNATVNINNNTNNNVSYCISSSATGQFGTGNHNIVVTNINSIFVASGTSDGAYQIKDGSVADNSGSDGTDRGAFGGVPENSYTLSGLPPIPVIYQIITTGIAGPSGLPVTIKARTIK